MRRAWVRTGIIAAALVVATSCGGEDDETQAATTGTTGAEQAVAAAPSGSEPTATTAAPAGGTAFGSGQGYLGGTVTVHAYDQPVATSSPQPAEAGYPAGYVWAAIDVEVCVPSDGPATVNSLPWKLAYADGALLTSTHTTYSGFPVPEYPIADTAVSAGQCVRGWVSFPVPPDGRPATVSYAPAPDMAPLTWAVPPG